MSNLKNINLKIRNPLPEDVEVINDVLKAGWHATYPNTELGITAAEIDSRFTNISDEELEKRRELYKNIPKNKLFLVAEVDNKVVGFFSAQKLENDEAKIGALYVLPEFHGQGIGAALMLKGLAWLKDCTAITLDCAEYNDHALNFYGKFGFKDAIKIESYKFPSGVELPEVRLTRKNI